MTASEYLEQIEKLQAMIETKSEEIVRLKALRDKTTASYGGEKVQTSGNPKKKENYSLAIIQLEEEMEVSVGEFADSIKEAMKLIDRACDADCIKLLYKRYFLCMKWEEIAVDMNYTYQWISGGLHQRALSQVQKALDERSRNDRLAEKEG